MLRNSLIAHARRLSVLKGSLHRPLLVFVFTLAISLAEPHQKHGEQWAKVGSSP
jgi:hypothetical protein